MTIGQNTLKGELLLEHIGRIEALKKEIEPLNNDIKVIYAQAVKNGFSAKAIRAMVKVRAMTPSEFRETEDLRDLYLHAIGLAGDLPLFKYMDGLARDSLAIETFIDRFKALVPKGASIIVEQMGSVPFRVWRDGEGAHSEEHRPPPAPEPEKPARFSEKSPDPSLDAVSDDEAEEMGHQAAKDDLPIIGNPFPFADKRRARWDLGWRKETGTDGMGPGEDE